MEPGNLNHRWKSLRRAASPWERGSGLWDLKAKMLEDLFDHLLILNETNDLHLPLTFGARERINLIYFLNQPCPVFRPTSFKDFFPAVICV
jgi:hypothetical protein